MSGRCRGRARNIWVGRAALALFLTGSTLLSAIGTVALPFSAHAQSEGDWVDPLADPQMTDISANVDQTIADVWTDDAGDDWVEPEPVVAAPVEYSAFLFPVEQDSVRRIALRSPPQLRGPPQL